MLVEAEHKLSPLCRSEGYLGALCVTVIALSCDSRQRMVRKAKMKAMRGVKTEDSSSDSEAPSPKRQHLCPEDEDFVEDAEDECESPAHQDALSFDDSSESYDYSQSSPNKDFVLPMYAAAKARADARNRHGTNARVQILFLHALDQTCFAQILQRGNRRQNTWTMPLNLAARAARRRKKKKYTAMRLLLRPSGIHLPFRRLSEFPQVRFPLRLRSNANWLNLPRSPCVLFNPFLLILRQSSEKLMKCWTTCSWGNFSISCEASFRQRLDGNHQSLRLSALRVMAFNWYLPTPSKS